MTLIKNAHKPLAKSVLVPLGLTATAGSEVHKKVLESGMTAFIISNEEMKDIMKTV